jgi:dTDP-4-dehydrorhamnose 3,5-epimerase
LNKLKITPLKIEGTFVVETNSFKDSRGVFSRYFCQEELKTILKGKNIVNVNYSKNHRKGAVRGLHYQKEPYGEIKMPRCIKGKIIDVFVDVRKESKTFLQWDSVELSAENQKMLIIPEGFAHGFQSLEDNSEILYLSTEYFNGNHEYAINIKDPLIGVDLPLLITDISERDTNHSFLDLSTFEGVQI